AEQYLWYRKTINYTSDVSKKTLIHFGAVDNEATVFVNGKEIGKHAGGYTEFSFDITAALKNGGNEIIVKVFDPTDQGVYPHGKQVSNPQNIYYTPSSGIWQTVWLETVPVNYIQSLKFTPDIDKGILNITVNAPAGFNVEISAQEYNNVAGSVKGKTNAELKLPVKNAKLWTPENPFLYDLSVKLTKGGKIVDEVKSYFGMRKVSVGKDEKGYYRIFLNNKYVFNLGTLDQGFWPDGLYTAPTDEALKFDIEAIKAMGFNTIRKHIKVEPARWYYHADKLGMLIWQDFVNPNQGLPEGSKPAFEKQLSETIAQLYNHPAITTWVLFNERWGRYDQERLTDYVKKQDPSRLLNAHSGEMLWVNEQLRDPAPNAWVNSDIADVHAYPDPINAPAKEGRVQILGEFGGIGVFIPDHQWLSNKSWGYVQVTPAQLLGKYTIMNEHLQLLEKEGLAGSIYTQPFDVEGEENGIMTYDREVIKMPFEELRKVHGHIVPDIGTVPQVTAQNADITDPGILYSRMLQQFIDGKNEPAFLKKLADMAAQVNDKDGIDRAGNAYIASLKTPLSEEDIKSVAQFTKSTKDPGFKFMLNNEEQFKKVIGDRQFTVNMMNMIFKGDMEPMVENNPHPDWKAIEAKVKSYGAPGEEILLRAKTVHYINAQDWDNYVPVAKEYLAKYKANIRANELQMFQQAIDEHSGDAAKNVVKEMSGGSSAKEKMSVEETDKLIADQIINPVVNTARSEDKIPDWAALTKTVTEKYDAMFADRTVTRAKLFFYYGKDWKQFATAIVNYTEKFENKDDLKTMNTNANFVLQHSSDKSELQKALEWSKMLVQKDPQNEEYKTTLTAIENKLK
ncbi:MAG: hypothetical protein J7497_11050, partial [Chitinophagaceae bacterium]|nr:hypothetical protein [Chitinophagaceae bacterium]